MKCICQLALLALPLVVVNPATAAEKDLTAKGEALVRQNCSRCHAIGKEGDSPHPQAPPFRTLSNKYPIENLAESLAAATVAIASTGTNLHRSPRLVSSSLGPHQPVTSGVFLARREMFHRA